jgi:SAM-dependent methyltransferase
MPKAPMERVPEPEVMDEPAQALAYARADFAEVNEAFAARFREAFPDLVSGRVLDLGCGPADIPLRLASLLPGLRVTAVDASAPMLAHGRAAARAHPAGHRVDLVRARLPHLPFSAHRFDAVISNSLLHHLPRPEIFWQSVRACARPGAAVLVMDLLRPASARAAEEIVRTYAALEAPLLRRDFYCSLLAAFTVGEVRTQLGGAMADLHCRRISDRHWAAWGRMR